ncbi:hypothetical protein F5879DRAFT_995631 [Lentinula edodes]|nr:hypothetical protein F5879DRAFT_995631 [Lentinula edodes]
MGLVVGGFLTHVGGATHVGEVIRMFGLMGSRERMVLSWGSTEMDRKLPGVQAPYLRVMTGFAYDGTPLASLHLTRDLLTPASFTRSPFFVIIAIIGVPTNRISRRVRSEEINKASSEKQTSCWEKSPFDSLLSLPRPTASSSCCCARRAHSRASCAATLAAFSSASFLAASATFLSLTFLTYLPPCGQWDWRVAVVQDIVMLQPLAIAPFFVFMPWRLPGQPQYQPYALTPLHSRSTSVPPQDSTIFSTTFPPLTRVAPKPSPTCVRSPPTPTPLRY